MSLLTEVTVAKLGCPPMTWAWLEAIIRDHAPDRIYLVEESTLHKEFRQRAWDELHANKLNDKERMLRSALLVTIHKSNNFRPCWAVARDLFAIGSTSAYKICRELGIDPELLAGEVPE